MKITVVYHSADYDGVFCREIARNFLPDANLIGWDWADAKMPFPKEGTVYVLDLSPDCFESFTFDDALRLIWIDHHKSAIEKYAKYEPPLTGYRIDGVAACRLAWQWFNNSSNLPEKEAFTSRIVQEPLAVRLAGEYDVWDKRDPNVDVFQYALRGGDVRGLDFSRLLIQDSLLSKDYIYNLMETGEVLMKTADKANEFTTNSYGFLLDFEGLKFLALNTPQKSSMIFKSRDIPSTGHDALLKFSWSGAQWDISLYHAAHRTDLDLSTIAVKYGGGGHRGACGFRASKLPFVI